MSAYYNEIDPFAVAWLRELIKAGLIADGEVDDRSIELVRPDDLRGFSQCHFFAGIGGWSYALRLAGWPDTRECWTGSCPCQPFSSAGKGAGFDDSRHLWPAWFRLIGERAPATIFGEQVASRAGRGWFDTVSTDLEALDYAIGSADLGGPCVGAFDIRQRLWFVADARRERCERERLRLQQRGPRQDHIEARWCGEAGELADTEGARSSSRGTRAIQRQLSGQGGSTFWSDADWLRCTDGKWRAVEPGTFPLASGVSGRVGRLRGYGNSIKPPLAAAFIESYLACGQ